MVAIRLKALNTALNMAIRLKALNLRHGP
jgi:hypothetical protein